MERDANCVFCKIIDKQIAGNIVKDEANYIAIRDINPQAPTHILIIPKEHVPNITSFTDSFKLGWLFEAATQIGKEQGKNGFRVVVNTGPDGGQTVDHLHIHVLAGRFMGWPPG
jgi:histidine triad (HIT) family protein